MLRIWTYLLVASTLMAQVPQSPGGDPYYRAKLFTPTPTALQALLDQAGYDTDCMPVGPDFVEVVLSPQEYGVLQQVGFQPVVLETAAPLSAILGDIPVGYHDLTAIRNILLAKQAALPALCKVHNLSTAYGPSLTVEGRAIEAIKISANVLVDEDEPNILIATSHHAREISTPEEALDLIERLTAGYGVDPSITALLNTHEIWIVPVVNPDGVNTVWTTNNLWRKNRRNNGDGTFGVDLNRNYPHLWSTVCGGSTITSSETYRGPSAGSEVETQTMVNFSRSRRFAKVLDFHSYGRDVLLSYVCSPIPTALGSAIDSAGISLAASVGFGTRDPSAEGEHQIFQIGEITSYAYLIEMNLSFQPAYSVALSEAIILWPLVQSFFNKPMSIRGHVTDALSGLPIAANLTVNTVAWTQGETRKSRALNGAYDMFLPAGSHMITASAPGYQNLVAPVTVSATSTATLNLALQPLNTTFTLALSTNGGGFGNLNLALNNVPAGTVQGYTVFSFDTAAPVGTGALIGISPDALSYNCIAQPLALGSIFHWSWPASGVYPQVPIVFPGGSFPFPAGLQADGVAAAISASPSLLGTTQVVRITF